MRFAMTARTLARQTEIQNADVAELEVNDLTYKNVMKVTRFRKNGNEELIGMVEKMKKLEVRDRSNIDEWEVVGKQKKQWEENEKKRETYGKRMY